MPLYPSHRISQDVSWQAPPWEVGRAHRKTRNLPAAPIHVTGVARPGLRRSSARVASLELAVSGCARMRSNSASGCYQDLRYNPPDSSEAAPIVTYVDEASRLKARQSRLQMRTGHVPYSSALGRDTGASTLTAFVPEAP